MSQEEAPVRGSVLKVLLYVPNVVGYVRLLLLVSSVYIGEMHPLACFWLFIVNFLLDGADGALARRLKQVTILCSRTRTHLKETRSVVRLI